MFQKWCIVIRIYVRGEFMKENNVYEIKENAITLFKGKDFSFLSNMYSYKVEFEYNGLTFNSVESAYQAQKDPSKADRFSRCKRPDMAKRMGSNLKNIRSDWEEVKEEIMRELVFIKFSQNERLKERLLNTGDVQLVEGNTWGDTYWGVCNGVGLNKLGEILMEVREELRNEKNNKKINI